MSVDPVSGLGALFAGTASLWKQITKTLDKRKDHRVKLVSEIDKMEKTVVDWYQELNDIFRPVAIDNLTLDKLKGAKKKADPFVMRSHYTGDFNAISAQLNEMSKRYKKYHLQEMINSGKRYVQLVHNEKEACYNTLRKFAEGRIEENLKEQYQKKITNWLNRVKEQMLDFRTAAGVAKGKLLS